MDVTTLTQKGQVTIPRKIREEIGLKTSDKVLFEKRGDEIVIKPFKKNILDFKGIAKTQRKIRNYDKLRKIVKNKISQRIVKGI